MLLYSSSTVVIRTPKLRSLRYEVRAVETCARGGANVKPSYYLAYGTYAIPDCYSIT